jgi:hypothetical protein
MNRQQIPPQQPMSLNIDPATLPDLECEECKGTVFIQGHTFKKVSALVSPNGQSGLVPIEVLVCIKCNTPVDIHKV